MIQNNSYHSPEHIVHSSSFATPANDGQFCFSYRVRLDKGWLVFSEAALSHLIPEYTITRKTDALGGQTIAIRIRSNYVNPCPIHRIEAKFC